MKGGGEIYTRPHSTAAFVAHIPFVVLLTESDFFPPADRSAVRRGEGPQAAVERSADSGGETSGLSHRNQYHRHSPHSLHYLHTGSASQFRGFETKLLQTGWQSAMISDPTNGSAVSYALVCIHNVTVWNGRR